MRDGSKELEKIASLFIAAESKRKAVMRALETLLNEVEDGSLVSFHARQVGRPIKVSLKTQLIEAK